MRIRYCRWLFPEKLLLPDQIETSHSGVCKLQIPGWIQPGIFFCTRCPGQACPAIQRGLVISAGPESTASAASGRNAAWFGCGLCQRKRCIRSAEANARQTVAAADCILFLGTCGIQRYVCPSRCDVEHWETSDSSFFSCAAYPWQP